MAGESSLRETKMPVITVLEIHKNYTAGNEEKIEVPKKRKTERP